MLKLRKGSTEQELAGFFATLEEQPAASATPTRSAFSKARKQLSEKVFAALNRGAIATFRAGWKAPLWHGFRLFAVDGTTLRLPGGAALEAFFGAPGSGPTLARASVLYDIGHDLVVDTQVSATCVSARELAVEHLAAARPGDLLLYDRGYQAFWLFALHLMRGVEFCMRLPRGSFSAADAFWEGTEPPAIITLNPSAQQRRDCRAQGAPDVPLRVRLVRVRLRGGETESWPPRSWRRRVCPHGSSPSFITAAGAWRYPIEETAVKKFLTNQQTPPILGCKALLELAKWLEGGREAEFPGGLGSAAFRETPTPDCSARRIGSTPSRSTTSGGGEGR
jgi:hypothetical protein